MLRQVLGKTLIAGTCAALSLGMAPRFTVRVSEDIAVRVCVGEAEGETLTGKTALLEAFRRRGSVRGVFGYTRDISRAPGASWSACHEAWRRSASSNLVPGATGWGNAKDLARWRLASMQSAGHWWRRARVVAHIGRHWFYAIVS